MLSKIKNTLISIPSLWWLGVIILVSGIIRLINVSAEPLWSDEILSLSITYHFQHIPTLLQYLAEVEVHPPLYYLMLHFWTDWFGFSNIAVRSLSIIFGIGCIVIGYLLGKSIFQNQKIGLLSALIVAIFPFQIEFSQEARPYIIFCFFAGVSILAAWEYLKTRKKIWIPVYIVSSLLGIYLHYSYAFLLITTSLYWLYDIFAYENINRSRTFLIWLGVHSLIFLGFSFWLQFIFYKLILSDSTIFGLDTNLILERKSDFLPFSIDKLIWLNKLNVIPKLVILVKIVAQLFILTAIFKLIRNGNTILEKNTKEIIYLISLLFIPIILFLVSPQSVHYADFFVRHIIYCSIPLALLLAFLIASIDQKTAVVLCLLFFFSLVPFSVDILADDSTYDKYYQHQNIAEEINELYQPGDIVVVFMGVLRSDLNYYLDPSIKVVNLLPINYFGLDIWNTKDSLGLVENEYHFRYEKPNAEQIRQKLDRIDKLYQPKRYWLYGTYAEDAAVHDWFFSQGYSHRMRSIANIYLLDFYSK